MTGNAYVVAWPEGHERARNTDGAAAIAHRVVAAAMAAGEAVILEVSAVNVPRRYAPKVRTVVVGGGPGAPSATARAIRDSHLKAARTTVKIAVSAPVPAQAQAAPAQEARR